MPHLSLNSRIPLTHGGSMPVLGLGVWKIPDGKEVEDACRLAFDAGYRHVDTATYYHNEAGVGRAVLGSGIPREEIFVTTKLWPTDAIDVEAAFERSLKKLGLEYVDLYLVHWPVPLIGNNIWKKMERLFEQKLARSIGVSNYNVRELKDTLEHCSVAPSVNQIEFNPFNYEKETLEFCKKNNIVVEAYSPLTRGHELGNRFIGAIAQKHARSPAQVMLRWALQKGTVVIPKSTQKKHIEENAHIFDFSLTDEEVGKLDSLSQ